MAVFEYKAIAREGGKKVKGVIDADSPAAARRKLREQKLFPTKLDETFATTAGTVKSGEMDFSRVTVRDIALMTRQLAVLLHAGMPLAESLAALIEQTSRPKLQKALFDVNDRVREGNRLGDALAAHPKIFAPLYVNMVRAGESSGALERVLFRLADIMEHEAKMRAQVLSTLAYPAFMCLFAVAIISFLMLVIVPRITALFERQEQTLPRLTEMLITTTDFIGNYWYLIAGVVFLLLFLWRYWVSRPEGHKAWDRFKLTVPIYGSLQVKMVCARFARTLGTMLESGLTMMKALEVVNTVVQNKHIEDAMEEVKAGVRRGRDLAIPMKESGVFPPMLIHMVELGQRSGEIEGMLLKVAEIYDEDVRLSLDALVSLLEPVIIVVMGLFVGLLVLAILLPILNMSTNIG
jgi:general secretion pathway protein F